MSVSPQQPPNRAVGPVSQPGKPVTPGDKPAESSKSNPYVVPCSCGASISDLNPKTKEIWIVKEIAWQLQNSADYKNQVENDYKHLEEQKQQAEKAWKDYEDTLILGGDMLQYDQTAAQIYAKYSQELADTKRRFEERYGSLEPWSVTRYLKWANGNQGYKWSELYRFNLNTKCGQCDTCGSTVFLYGYCLRSAALGNIMFGFAGHHVGFTLKQLTDAADELKQIALPSQQNQNIHHAQYELGYDLRTQLQENLTEGQLTQQLPTLFKPLLQAKPLARAEATEKGVRVFTVCKPCGEATPETAHGGDNKEYLPGKWDAITHVVDQKWHGKHVDYDPPPPGGKYSPSK